MSVYWDGRPLMSPLVSGLGWDYLAIYVAAAISFMSQRAQTTIAQNSSTISSDSVILRAGGLSRPSAARVRLQASWSCACTSGGPGSASWSPSVVSKAECFGAKAGLGGLVFNLEAVLVVMTRGIAISQAPKLSLPLPASSTSITYSLPTTPASHS